MEKDFAYTVESILSKLDTQDEAKTISLAHFMPLSFEELRQETKNKLSREEMRYLYEEAQAQRKSARIVESRLLAHANPQLAGMVDLGLTQPIERHNYDAWFGGRASRFVRPGAVASMFSPAAYLTELYRETHDLYSPLSVFSLARRRPDLAELELSQSNLDDEISTLALSNELLLNNIQAWEGKDYDGVMEKLSTYRQTGLTPYHLPYEVTRNAILLRDQEFTAFTQNPEVAKLMDPASLLALYANISPELYQILIEEITPENADELIRRNFGDINVDAFVRNSNLARYYDLSFEELSSKFSLFTGDLDLSRKHYQNDQLLLILKDEVKGELGKKGVLIKRIPSVNSHLLNDAELIPQGDDSYLFNFSIPSSSVSAYRSLRLGTSSLDSDDLFESDDVSSKPNEKISIPVKLNALQNAGCVEITLTGYKSNNFSGDATSASIKFQIHHYPLNSFLLLFNKLVRLYKATDIDAVDIGQVIQSLHADELIIDHAVLDKLFYVKYYLQRYSIKVEDALVLSFADISQYTVGQLPSQFTRLFNTPPLNGREFFADNTELDLTPEGESDFFRSGVLKRAFQVNDIGLYRLWKLVCGEKEQVLTCSTTQLSALYRMSLLADLHHLTVHELSMLLSISPYAGQNFLDFNAEEWVALTYFLYECTQWLAAQQWTVSDIFLMLTDNYSTTLTPEIENLIATLRNGVSDTSLSGDALIQASAAFIAAATQLDSAETATAILLWINQLKPRGLSFDDFMDRVRQDSPRSIQESEELVAFCQVLGQLSLLLRNIGLSASELLLVVTQPERLQGKGTPFKQDQKVLPKHAGGSQELPHHQVLRRLLLRKKGLAESSAVGPASKPGHFQGKKEIQAKQDSEILLKHDLATLQALTHFHAWIMRCGSYATEVLTALGQGTLTVEQLSVALTLDAQEVAQALQQAKAGATVFSDWKTVDVTLQWRNAAAQLGITPGGVAAFITLKYIGESNASTPSYSEWRAVSTMLQAGLNRQQTADLQALLDEGTSTALSAYAIKNVMPIGIRVTSRDELYSYLLIDNQVSAQIITTRLAEAIASIQLYVNRALSGVETGVSEVVRTRQFFSDWDTYNKRYSTWAGVSLLVYYPENYIDPTLRIGQTKMMDNLLQQISQSQLNTDIVEEGFRNYLAAFEDVANLNVTSGYHNNVDINEGVTYFIGFSQTEPRQYYWRSVDHSRASGGRFAANAWGAWNEIVCAMQPYQDFIRPVLYKSRLYVAWVEQELRRNDEASADIVYYHFKLSRLLYDGSWASPFTFDVTEHVKEVSKAPVINENSIGFYCAEYGAENTLIIYFYKKQSTYTANSNIETSGFYIFSDMSTQVITPDRLRSFTRLVFNQLDTLSQGKINNRFSEIKRVDVLQSELRQDNSFTLEASIGDINYSITSAGALNLDLTPEFQIRHYANLTATDRLLAQKLQELVPSATHCFFYSELNPLFFDDPIDFIRFNIFEYEWWNIEFYGFTVAIYSRRPLLNLEDEILFLIFEGDFQSFVIVLDHPAVAFDGKMTIFLTLPLIFKEGRDLRLAKNLKLVKVHFTDELEEILLEMEELEELDLEKLEGHYEILGSVDINGSSLQELALIKPEDVVFSIMAPNEAKVSINAKQGSTRGSTFNGNREIYRFDRIRQVLSESWISAASALEIECLYQINRDSAPLAENKLIITLTKNEAGPTIALNTDANRAQYIQSGPYRTRLNTLFAPQLIERADLGIDTILTMDTQQLPEPTMGDGGYVRITLPSYDSSEHGNSRQARIVLGSGPEGGAGYYDFWQGSLTYSPQRVTFFVPLSAMSAPFFNVIDFPAELSSGLRMYLSCDSGLLLIGTLQTTRVGSHLELTDYTAATPPVAEVILLPDNYEEPMDFSGANALYFWEMFYYTPMMVFQRLLQEQIFTEATRWLQYVWNPAGYVVQGRFQDYYWNVRPLEENTSWNADPLDSVDPDAIAQNDPMHYKVASFMRRLDLLIARGDAAYRQLERDTLNEAKMWYVQALTLLGDESYIAQDTSWPEPRLDEAASLTTRNTYQWALFQVYQQVELPTPNTANSLTALFLPQLNEKLQGYWQTLAQRLFNLRHNLSIEGHPLSLSIFATPANPSELLNAAVIASQGGGNFPPEIMPLYRFSLILENAKVLVAQLTQFGNTLLSITERQDAEALSKLLQVQGSELALQSIQLQDQVVSEIDADRTVLQEALNGAQSRFNVFKALYDENVNRGEKEAMDLYLASSVITTSGKVLHMAAAAAEMVPNIFGFAVGGSRWGALFNATAIGVEIGSSATRIAADKISQSEIYRRRREDWETQRDNAEFEIRQLNAQLDALAIRRQAALFQKGSLETQQSQTQGQLIFLQSKFSNQALYNWLRGRLSALYYQFYDLTVSRCLMAEQAYRYELNDNAARFIRPGAWQGTYAGLLAGESLMLNLVQMEKSYLELDSRALEVTRTVSLAELYAGLDESDKFIFTDQVQALLEAGSGSAGTVSNGLSMTAGQLLASVRLADLNIRADYPADLGTVRRIKQISVSLPALVGPYQDVQAVLSYGGSQVMPRGCEALVVSNGINDSGQFVLDFNDMRYLPFEGITVDEGALSLSFPQAMGKQAEMLKSLNDIILHIRYTIRS